MSKRKRAGEAAAFNKRLRINSESPNTMRGPQGMFAVASSVDFVDDIGSGSIEPYHPNLYSTPYMAHCQQPPHHEHIWFAQPSYPENLIQPLPKQTVSSGTQFTLEDSTLYDPELCRDESGWMLAQVWQPLPDQPDIGMLAQSQYPDPEQHKLSLSCKPTPAPVLPSPLDPYFIVESPVLNHIEPCSLEAATKHRPRVQRPTRHTGPPSEHRTNKPKQAAPPTRRSRPRPRPRSQTSSPPTKPTTSTNRKQPGKKPGDRNVPTWPSYPPPSHSIPSNLTLYQLCQHYPNHLTHSHLDAFIQQRWSAGEIMASMPESCREELLRRTCIDKSMWLIKRMQKREAVLRAEGRLGGLRRDAEDGAEQRKGKLLREDGRPEELRRGPSQCEPSRVWVQRQKRKEREVVRTAGTDGDESDAEGEEDTDWE